jgi:hypothetical protein
MAVTFNPFTGNLDFIDTTAAAGSDTEIQFNDGGKLAGDPDLSWDTSGTTKVLGVGGDVNLDDGGTYTTTLQTVTPTQNNTISFPNATGTVGLVAGSSGQITYNNAGAYAGLSTFTTDGTNITLTGRMTNSTNAAASAPAHLLSGTWFAGANNTSFPNLYVAPSAAAVGTAWSTLGTGFGVNSIANFTGDLIHLLQNGTSRFRLTGMGRFFFGEQAVSGPALTVAAPGRFYSGTGTYTDNTTANSGTVTHGAMVSIDNPAIASTGTSVTYTNASSFYIDGAPTNGTNVTITNSYSFFVNAGASYFGGNLQLAGGSNVVLSATTGTQIGTADTQLLGFYGKTAIARPASADQAALGAVTTVGTNTGTPGAGLSLIGDTTTVDQSGALMNDLAALREDLAAAFTLINQLRTDLVNIGLIKGAA